MDVPYDPDFDEPERLGMFDTLAPRWAFTAGAALAVLGLGTIGFLYLLFYSQ